MAASVPEKLSDKHTKEYKQTDKHPRWFCLSYQKHSQQKHSPEADTCFRRINRFPPIPHKKYQHHGKDKKCKLVRIIEGSHKPGTTPGFMEITPTPREQNKQLKYHIDAANPAQTTHKAIWIQCPEHPYQTRGINPIHRMQRELPIGSPDKIDSINDSDKNQKNNPWDIFPVK